MTFIIYLILINFFLFLPRYLLGLPERWNPLAFLFREKSLTAKIRNLYFSRAIDPFRLSVEYSLFALFIFSFGLNNDLTLGILSILGLLVFVFNIYLSVFSNLLHKTPVIKSDWLFMKNSISFYKGFFLLVFIGATFFLLTLAYVFLLLSQKLASCPTNLVCNFFCLLCILTVGFFNIKPYNLTDYMYRTTFSIVIYFFKSFQHSSQYDHLLNISRAEIESLNIFSNVSLKQKPNIHIISMESYGSVVFKEEEKYSQARKSLDNWNEKFQKSDIQAISSFAVPPLFATGTWYSYSTLLFGMNIDNGIKHNLLFKDMANFMSYESLFQFTKREGYQNFLLHGLIGNFDDTLDFEKTKRNLNYDVLLHNEHLDYKGKDLKFMRMQKSAPDQFTLNKGLEIIKDKKEPYTLFYCTLNSHWDFHSPITIADDWKKLNNEKLDFKTTVDTNLSMTEKYAYAIDYTINTVFDAIFNNINDNDIYIVYGDHQPTTLTDEKFGQETPMHIFSKNENFMEEWKKYGFKEGILPEKQEEYLKFEAFYSVFMSCLNKVYGKDTTLKVPMLKEGISFES